MRVMPILLAMALLIPLAGCGPPPAAPPVVSRPPSPPAPPAPPKPPAPPVADAPGSQPAPPLVETGSPPLDPAAKKADVGVGKKGQYNDNAIVAPISTPIKANFRMRESIVFRIQIPSAMQYFKAVDPRGKGPKSHAEFMDKIIKANQIELPQLPDREEYQYDPSQEELMVVPKK